MHLDQGFRFWAETVDNDDSGHMPQRRLAVIESRTHARQVAAGNKLRAVE